MKKSELIRLLNNIEGDPIVMMFNYGEGLDWEVEDVKFFPEQGMYIGQVMKHVPEHILIS